MGEISPIFMPVETLDDPVATSTSKTRKPPAFDPSIHLTPEHRVATPPDKIIKVPPPQSLEEMRAIFEKAGLV